MATKIRPTGKEVVFPAAELIVSKTDLKGRITYANRTFCRIAGYSEAELLGQPHSIIRHPDMPRAVFRLVWETIAAGREMFGYVKNMAHSGDHYWVFAHITPSFDDAGKIIGYHSNRRAPDRSVVETAIAPLYAEVLRIENSHANGKDAVEAGTRALVDFVASKKVSYDELMFALQSAA
ncbi:putative PAS/PAC sensor protein [Rhodopseudomonas palustris HaA2]|uniref:Putative PAS/PAC sensor protein n=1 Tax=Rhodopseudomonas palustris (strain HaA2) TaxID=316058 RepID=Q2J179_RHOP2|nr:PAS domain-containing protein [Rhodopseudomonas palustris]ABD05781.1 putative PAS/PAC sensor protein [Rhodopseudomonas palustris HaA2]